ncbi:hypothetical protein RDV89_12080 [Nocardioides zeae]|uniref:Glycosyltransferase RgtA/B/C/D-like domain-containing protein n=1 Tax=Nocardioides imazamoxiresistens TaxID=3231893 RepID=A0ABU3PY45_9ACTN|nr:hypothetical protein [Nocardioides zeae]MDT9593811.1 hypothetical protein [Nocardioides zeae]
MLLTRAVDVVLLVVLGRDQVALDVGQGFYLVEPTPADPGYFSVVTNWDGQWYRTIAEEGYPSELPLSPTTGEVAQNPWAFYPALPLLARLVMTTGVPFGVAASTISLLASTLALVLLYRLLAARGGRYVALLTVAALSASPTAAVLQTAYTEGLSLLLVVLALQALVARRYGALAVVAVALALTRPVVLALVPVILVHAYLRWRRDPTFGRRDAARIAGTVAVTGLSFGIWPLVAALRTGRADAYLATQQAWILDDTPWQTWGAQLLGAFGANAASGVAMVALLVAAIVLQPAARVWPTEVRAWVLAYGAYLLVTTRPTPSIARYCLLLLVVWWPFPTLGRTWHRAAQAALLGAVLLVGALAQYAWLEDSFLLTLRRIAYP